MVTHLGVAVEVDVGGERRRVRVKRSSGIVVGDVVVLDGDRVESKPRRTALLRAAPGGGEHVVAANLDALGIVAAVDPPARAGLIDRAAVAARAAGITPFLILNKVDLPGAAAIVAEQIARVAGDMRVVVASAASGEGMEELRAAIAAFGRCALVGPSGVGKSSLVNRLAPSAALATSTLSSAHGTGRHTTTSSMLLRLESGGELVDTPGVREYGLVDVTERELAAYFPGFLALADTCRFRDCLHDEEPGCAVRAGLEAGSIAAPRYAAYRTLLAELAAARARGPRR